MPGSDGLRIFGDFWKKAVSWDLKLDEANWFLDMGEASPVGSTRCAARGGIKWNSQQSKNCVSLSERWKPKSQGGNKSFVPEQRKSSVFRVFRIPMHMNIVRNRTFHVSVYLYSRIRAILYFDYLTVCKYIY